VLPEVLAAIAAAGGTAVVQAMATDSWESVKGRLAQIFGRRRPDRTGAIEIELEASRAELAGVPKAELPAAQAIHSEMWKTRLSELLEDEPEVEPELRSWIEEVRASAATSTGPVSQTVVGLDHSQQAALGHGVQNVTFGDRHDRN
jgi:hypothetical protein